MNNAITFTFGDVVTICAAVITISGAIAIFWNIYKAAKAPADNLERRVTAIEERISRHDDIFDKDKRRLDAIEEGNRVTQRAILALLDHGLDGNNIDQMQKAKEDLQKHLIEK